MEISIDGALMLRNAIIEQACADYVKEKKFIMRNPNPVLIDKGSEVSSHEWKDIRDAHSRGELDDKTLKHYENLHKKTFFKKHYMDAVFTVKDLTWWFGSKQFRNFNLSLDRETMISKLNERCENEIKAEDEEAGKKYKKHSTRKNRTLKKI